jgi:ribonucleoside-diphosphate reductase alpha chain
MDASEHGPEWVTANDVTGKEHLLMQAAAQKWIDSSVSKTVNMPFEATQEQVQEVYDLAWDLGCKGLAVYRDKSRDKQVLYREDPNKKIAELEAKIEFLQAAALRAGSYSAHPGKNGFDTAAVPMLVFESNDADKCPVDGGDIAHVEGCKKCLTCSWSAC